jgi:hypothetical protein
MFERVMSMVFTRYFTLLALVAGVVLGAAAEKPERSSGHEQIPGWATNTLRTLEYGFLIEVEGFSSKIGGKNESDIVLATVAFDLEASMTDWMSGHIGLLWEEYSREDNNIDEAYIAFGASEDIPFYLVAGRFYQPVGNFESAFVSDPLTLELIEMNTESVMVGVGNGWGDFNIGALNGDVKEGVSAGEGGDSTISDFFASASFTPIEQVQFGLYWLSDLMEAYNQIPLGELIADQPGYKEEGAAGAFLNLYFDRLTLNAEYVSALDGYEIDGGNYLPAALHLEASVQISEKVAAGVMYGASDDLFASYDGGMSEKLPGEAAGMVVSYDFQDYATLAAEYLHVEQLDNGEDGDIFTLQLGLAF